MLRFTNNGNDCYLNSVLQVLFNLPAFLYPFAGTSIKCNGDVMRAFDRLYNNRNRVNTPKIIKNILSGVNKESFLLFGNSGQQDAHEAIMSILDIVHHNSVCENPDLSSYGIIDSRIKKKSYKEWEKNAKLFGYSYITNFFNGQFKTLIKCNNCDYENINFEIFNCINLEITGNEIIDCLDNFIEKECIMESICEKCKNRGLIKQTTIWKFPLVLILNIKRYSVDNGRICKNNKSIKINKSLFIRSSGIIHTYKLNSVVYHHGSLPTSGHYTSDILKNGLWYKADDDNVQRTERPKYSSNCYIIIYNNNNK